MTDNSLKILFLTPLLEIGGEELSTLSLIKEMVKKGHRCYVYGNKGALYEEFIHSGAVIINPDQPYERTVRGVIRDSRKIKNIVVDNNIDIVHSQSILPTISSYIANLLLKNRKNIPKLIFHERGIHEYNYPIIGRLFNHITDYVIANSDYEREKLLRNGLKPSHCTRIHNCINFDFPQDKLLTGQKRAMGIDSDNFVIGTVGRLVKQKGIKYLLKAFKIVCDSNDCIFLIIVGDGPDREILEKKTDSLGISKKVLFTGWKRDIKSIYPIFDIFILPSLWEPLGNVALEAAGFGKPVIVSKVDGLPETMIPDKTGLIVPPSDAQKLADAIIYLIENKDIAKRMGENGRQRVKDYFCSSRVGNEVEEVYKVLLSNLA